MHLKLKRRNRASIKHALQLKEIWDMYYKQDIYENKVRGEVKKVSYYSYSIDEIINKFNIKTITELIFLLHHHAGEVIKECEFCGKKCTKVKLRSTTSFDQCSCKGICLVCKEVYQYANEDGVCYDCKPHCDQKPSDDFDDVRYRFLSAVGNHSFIYNIDCVEELQRMMEMSSYYYYFFKDRMDSLTATESQ